MSNYSAVVTTITNLRPHSNADRLVCTSMYGGNVIVGKDTKIGDVGLFFPLESQIGEKFAIANDLIRRKDENGKNAGGMFDQNRRVRAQTFRGERSEGFWIPIDSITKLFPDWDEVLKEGQEIDTLRGEQIATKYFPKRIKSASTKGNKKPKKSRIVPGQFAFHFDTPQLARNVDKLNLGGQVTITWKVHGTSAIAARVLVNRKLNLLERFLRVVGVRINDTEYDYVYASRKVIKSEAGGNHFYKEDLWTRVGQEQFGGLLEPGETVYYEITGYTSDGKFIQQGYDYGSAPGEYKIWVYRITRTGASGHVTELTFDQLVARCDQLGVQPVELAWRGEVSDLVQLGNWHERFVEEIKKHWVHDQDCQLCKNKVPSEGVCVRIDHGLSVEIYKLKNFRFLERETKQLDDGQTDIETEQSELGA